MLITNINTGLKEREGKEMKIAIASNDKKTISEHFGGAPYFVVVEVEEEKIRNKEVREKPGHKDLAQEEEYPQTGKEGVHGFTAKASERHKKIAGLIKDCKVVIAGRMGLGAYEDLRDLGFEVITTDIKEINEIVSLYAKSKLSHMVERLH